MSDVGVNAEEKIREIARSLFYKKGYAKTTTREIAQLAGVNTALLNYYFRSKEQLFSIIMTESIYELSEVILYHINDETLSLSEKIKIVVDKYFEVLTKNPSLPIFVLSELRNNSDRFLKKINIPDSVLNNSNLKTQIEKQIHDKQLPGTPLDYIVNILSMSVMPFAVKDLVQKLYYIDDNEYKEFVAQRKEFIPIWIKTILKLDE